MRTSGRYAVTSAKTLYHLSYVLLEFQKAVKQMTAKPSVDYFQRACDATIMHEVLSRGCCQIMEQYKVRLMLI